MIVFGTAEAIAAQVSQPAQTIGKRQAHTPTATRVVLEVRRLTVNANFNERIEPPGKKLPKTGSYAMLSREEADYFVIAAEADMRSNAAPPRTVELPNGERSKWSPLGADHILRGSDAIRAAISDDRRSIDIRLTWANRENGHQQIPAMATKVPVGSSLLIHVDDGSFRYKAAASASIWERIQRLLLHRTPPPSFVTDPIEEHLLITPVVSESRLGKAHDHEEPKTPQDLLRAP